MADPFDLDRFLTAQADVYDDALRELAAGEKRTHWMWFIFPQIRGLGLSAMAARYAIDGVDEARAYLAHPVLGPRLEACVRAVNAVSGRSAREIFGPIDAIKFRSSMTLFELAAGPGSVFAEALDRFYDGARDDATLARVGP